MPPVPTNFPPPFTVGGIPTMGMNGLPLTAGNVYFVDPVNGSDGYPGTANQPLQSLYRAHAKCTAGNNDVVVLIGNGSSTGTARLSLAAAQAVNSAATSGTLLWTKNATHLVGITAPTQVAQRARIAPLSTDTQSGFGSGNLVTVSASGCMFMNVSLFHGFATGGTNQVCWTDTGSRNYYGNMDFGGMGDTTSAGDTGSSSFLLGGGGNGEHTFVNCNFGLDTVTRGVANATLVFTGGAPRCVFRDCNFLMDASASTPLHVSAPAGSLDRTTLFDNCFFSNAVESGATTISAAIVANASAGGALVLQNPVSIGATAIATTGPVYGVGAVPTATTSGIAIKLT